MKVRKRLPLLLAILTVANCASTPDPSVGDLVTLGQASQDVQAAARLEFTPKDEYYIGRSASALILKTRKVYDNKIVTGYVNLLGSALAMYSDLPETFGGYHFTVLDSGEINGFAAPGGFIIVSMGLLRCAKTEEEAAAILAQLISHVVLRHGMQAIKEQRKAAAYNNLAMAAVESEGSPEGRQMTLTFRDSVASITGSLVNADFSQKAVLEADIMATAIMRRAGYDPHALITLLQTMKAAGGTSQFKPTPDERIAEIKKTLVNQPPFPAIQETAAQERVRRFEAALGSNFGRGDKQE